MAPVPLVGNWYLGMLQQLQQPLAINRRIFFISHTAELTACTSTGILFLEIGSIVSTMNNFLVLHIRVPDLSHNFF